jgi:hypothetical protein
MDEDHKLGPHRTCLCVSILGIFRFLFYIGRFSISPHLSLEGTGHVSFILSRLCLKDDRWRGALYLRYFSAMLLRIPHKYELQIHTHDYLLDISEYISQLHRRAVAPAKLALKICSPVVCHATQIFFCTRQLHVSSPIRPIWSHDSMHTKLPHAPQVRKWASEKASARAKSR